MHKNDFALFRIYLMYFKNVLSVEWILGNVWNYVCLEAAVAMSFSVKDY